MKHCKWNGIRTGIGMLVVFGVLGMLLLAASPSRASVSWIDFAVNGDTTATSMVQGDELSWGSDCAVGASMFWEIWYDVDMSGDIDELIDASIVGFQVADGDTNSDGPPPDIDPVPDGIYWSAPMMLGIPAGDYVFRVTDLSDASQSWQTVTVTALPSPPNTFVGRIVLPETEPPDAALAYLWVEAAYDYGAQMWAAFTDDSGKFEINVSNSGTGLMFDIETPDVSGFTTPAQKQFEANGVVDVGDFIYEVPSDSVYGTVTDDNGDPIPYCYVYAYVEGGGQNKDVEASDGEYVMYFTPSEAGTWQLGVSTDMLIPNYVVPQGVEITVGGGTGIEQNLVCPIADQEIYVLVTENGGNPEHSYLFDANCPASGYFTRTVTDTGSANVGVLHTSSACGSGWWVNVQTWDSAYQIPPGYFVEDPPSGLYYAGDTVYLNFIEGATVRDTIKVDPGDSIPYMSSVWINLSQGGYVPYYGHPDESGVYQITAAVGTYTLTASANGYYSVPTYRQLTLAADTTGNLGFTLNRAHCRISGQLQGVPLPLSGHIYVVVASTTIALAATVDTMTGTFGVDVFDANWTLTPPSIDGYSLPDTMQFAIGEIPDTSRTANFSYSPVLDVDGDGPEGLPGDFRLNQNRPNPFNPTTLIEYDVPRSAPVTVAVYNLLGQHVKTLVDEVKGAGTHTVEWNGTDGSGHAVASGIYLYRLNADGFTQTKKMLLMK